jgi:predicted small metal-binding protein
LSGEVRLSYREANYEKPKAIRRYIINDENGNPKYIIQDISPMNDSSDIHELRYTFRRIHELIGREGHEESNPRHVEFAPSNLSVSCRDVGLDCDYKATGGSEPELTANLLDHYFRIHDYTQESFTESKILQKLKQHYPNVNYEEGYKGLLDIITGQYADKVKDIERLWNQQPPIRESIRTQQQFMTKLPPEVIEFVLKLNVNQNERHNLDKTLESIQKYLESENIDHHIHVGISSDPQYPTYRDIEFNIKVKEDYDTIEKKLEPKIYSLVEEFLPQELGNKIIIDMEPYR